MYFLLPAADRSASHQSFVNELSLMKDLSHPNIVKLVGFVENMEKGDAWMILPWEDNGNVREFLLSGEWDIPERISLVSLIYSAADSIFNIYLFI